MPITAYGHANAFSQAAENCVIKHLNNAPMGEGGVDAKTQQYLAGHGICSGITTTWLIGFLHARPEASTVAQFDGYFQNVLRFQGAYLKECHGKADDHIDELAQKSLDVELNQVEMSRKANAAEVVFQKPTWGAYVSIWGHAIGIGQDANRWYMMDPNYGLFVYDDKARFVHDLDEIVEARRARAGKKATDTIGLLVFKKK